ncbi:MAG: Lipoprotein-releasing system ATP-binding protein LolD [Lentisphaerae bacterium ADurb.BinA184]|nr:MAG: Lipoprotein-releasing system ATP-binding protein LolD [Lentisphaerae bacterium ADurb.BinA184]
MTATPTAPAGTQGSTAPTAPADGARRVIIRTVGLRKSYLKKGVVTEALRGVDMEILTGEFIAIMGPSGSGKTTFFNMVGGLDSPTSGRVFIDEVDVAQLTAVELAFLRCRKIGYIFQQFNLIPYMTALENVTTPMAFAGTDPDTARNRGMELLGTVGLRERWFHRPIEMSGGQQQRVAIARSMAHLPAILLCDEPTGNLDLKTGREILDLLKRLNTERGVTIICATHDPRMLDLCDRLMWLRDGQVERVARREEVRITIGKINNETE